MVFVAHVTVEVPAKHVREAGEWYRTRFGLHRVSNPIVEPHTGHDAIHFAEGIHIVPQHGVWEQPHLRSLSHFCIKGDSDGNLWWQRVLEQTADDKRFGITDQRFFVRDPWSNKIEVEK
jgi:catechol 2,3-dioxygenase-like lactoylglutathione lyase family enzyme